MVKTTTSRDWLIKEVNYLIDQQKGYIDALKDHADKTEDEDLKRHLLDFRADHEVHQDRLQRVLESLKGEDLGMPFGGGKAIMDSAQDTDYSSLFRECLVEQALLGAYSALVQVTGSIGEPELERICRENTEDDRRHLEYLQSHFKESVVVFAGGIPPYEAAA